MKHVDERDVDGIRAPAPNTRTLKHLAAPWTIGSENLWVGLSEIDPGSSSNPHAHERNEEVFYVVEGAGVVEVGDERVDVGPGSLVVVPPGQTHRLANRGAGTLKVLCCASPPFDKGDFEAKHKLAVDDA